MTKVIKRIASIGTAIMMMGTMVISATAKSESYITGGTTVHCSSSQSSANTWIVSTSINKANGSVSASGTGTYYTSITRKTATTSNANGGNAGTSCSLRNNYGYGWKDCSSNHTYATSSHGMYTTGSFVNS